jgi:molecular chaperone GrpE
MAYEDDTTREQTVGPGEENPGGGPAAPDAPPAPDAPSAPEAPTVPAGEPEAPVGPATVPPDEEKPDNGGEPVDHHERLLERDLEELTAKAEKADEYLELAKRTKADFENYRKRAAREAASAQERGIAKLARELLPAVDNLERAVQAAEAGGNGEAGDVNGAAATLVSGIKLVHADVLAALQRAGIERYSPEGERFDPQQHEAIAQQPVEGAESGTVVEVYQRGYRLGEVVIRPARVVVAA